MPKAASTKSRREPDCDSFRKKADLEKVAKLVALANTIWPKNHRPPDDQAIAEKPA